MMNDRLISWCSTYPAVQINVVKGSVTVVVDETFDHVYLDSRVQLQGGIGRQFSSGFCRLRVEVW